MLQPFYAAVKAILPGSSSTVIGGASLDVPIGWWQQLIAAGGLNDLDVASIHPYTGNNDSFEEYGNIPAIQTAGRNARGQAPVVHRGGLVE